MFYDLIVFLPLIGFLIAGLLAAEWATGRPSLAGFYARRVRRLFPALALVLGTCLAAGSILLMPDELKALAKQAAAGAGFTANFLFWRQADYFDPASELKPLLHLWSLAVEEQFYLVFPLLLWGLLKTVGQRRARQVVAALALLPPLLLLRPPPLGQPPSPAGDGVLRPAAREVGEGAGGDLVQQGGDRGGVDGREQRGRGGGVFGFFFFSSFSLGSSGSSSSAPFGLLVFFHFRGKSGSCFRCCCCC